MTAWIVRLPDLTFGKHRVQGKNGYLQQTGTVSERRVIGGLVECRDQSPWIWPKIAMRLERFYSVEPQHGHYCSLETPAGEPFDLFARPGP